MAFICLGVLFPFFGFPHIGYSTCGDDLAFLIPFTVFDDSLFYLCRRRRPISGTGRAEALQQLGLQIQREANVILPQAFSISVPAIVANIIFLLKETSVFSAISLMDLMFTAKDLIGQYYNTTECLFMLVGFYIVMLLPVSILGSLVEHKARYRMFGD